jgi:hypothetical protein
MRFQRHAVILLTATLISGCAVQDMFCNLIEPDSYALVSVAQCQTIQVSFEYDAGTDFSRFQSYDWLPVEQTHPAGSADPSGLLDHWVTEAVDARLAEQGLRRDGEAPDFLVSYEAPIENRGTLTLAFIHADSRQLIWRGESRDEGYPARNPTAWEGRIRLAVDKLLAQFPATIDE